MKRIALVSCVSKKTQEPNKASDLYISTWFKKCKKYVEINYEDWYIISAKYGLINNSDYIQPYNLCLSDMSTRQKQDWAKEVVETLINFYPDKNIIADIYAGNLYRKHLIRYLSYEKINYTIPLAGLGIGQQLSELGRMIK